MNRSRCTPRDPASQSAGYRHGDSNPGTSPAKPLIQTKSPRIVQEVCSSTQIGTTQWYVAASAPLTAWFIEQAIRDFGANYWHTSVAGVFR